jgi:uncharacterized membrane protein
MRKTIAKAVTWRLIGTAEIFAISFWTTGHLVTAGHMAGIAAISSLVMYVAHELAWEAGIRESFSFCWDNLAVRRQRPDLLPATTLWSRPRSLPETSGNDVDGHDLVGREEILHPLQ